MQVLQRSDKQTIFPFSRKRPFLIDGILTFLKNETQLDGISRNHIDP